MLFVAVPLITVLNDTHMTFSKLTQTGPMITRSNKQINCSEFYNIVRDYQRIYLDTLQLEKAARSHEEHGYADSVFSADQSQLNDISYLALGIQKYSDGFNLDGINLAKDCPKSEDVSEKIEKAMKLHGMRIRLLNAFKYTILLCTTINQISLCDLNCTRLV